MYSSPSFVGWHLKFCPKHFNSYLCLTLHWKCCMHVSINRATQLYMWSISTRSYRLSQISREVHGCYYYGFLTNTSQNTIWQLLWSVWRNSWFHQPFNLRFPKFLRTTFGFTMSSLQALRNIIFLDCYEVFGWTLGVPKHSINASKIS